MGHLPQCLRSLNEPERTGPLRIPLASSLRAHLLSPLHGRVLGVVSTRKGPLYRAFLTISVTEGKGNDTAAACVRVYANDSLPIAKFVDVVRPVKTRCRGVFLVCRSGIRQIHPVIEGCVSVYLPVSGLALLVGQSGTTSISTCGLYDVEAARQVRIQPLSGLGLLFLGLLDKGGTLLRIQVGRENHVQVLLGHVLQVQVVQRR